MDYNKTIKLERIPRTADAMQWVGDNTEDIQEFLLAHLKTGEYRNHNGLPLIFVRGISEHSLEHTLYVGDWLLEGEDGKLRFYSDTKKKIMYQMKSNELERIRAFARDMADITATVDVTHQIIDIYLKNGLKEYLRESKGYKNESLKAAA